ncbi:hypothetical protein H6G74_28765 [Nostoc spongiaeforme FACHB-130]|uniref:Uncharacterized protein n=1 Tax=Nostoc spongiaeforme FACHB-130 TaxID=1357510 RepID=A0ABR8G4W7_9NOSO|nr:hypothetical protein [Nostoc spongiaeforme]MBD2598288.1 hypothetical protein [Nostoc spongiaeforme FACHB-130]
MMAEVTITYKNGNVETKTLPADEAGQLTNAFVNRELLNISQITVKILG